MKAALFLAVGAVFYRAQTVQLTELAGIGRRMPLTIGAFTIAGFGLVGTPGTAGFISKWYLAVGALDKGSWALVFAIVASSLIALVYIGRALEVAWLREPAPAIAHAADPPLSMTLPLLVLAVATVYFGVDTEWTVGVAAPAAQGPPRRAAMTAVLSPDRLVLLALLLPFAGALIIPLFRNWPNLRESVTLATAALLCLAVVRLLASRAGRSPAGSAPHRRCARPRARLESRAARHAVRARRLHAVDRQFDLFDRLHAGQQRAAPDQLLCLLRRRSWQHDRHRLRQKSVHVVPILRGADDLDLSRW